MEREREKREGERENLLELRQVSMCRPCWPGTHYIALVGLDCKSALLQPSK